MSRIIQGPQTLSEFRLESEFVGLSQIPQDEMTLEQAQYIHQLDIQHSLSISFLDYDTGPSQVPTLRSKLESALDMEAVTWGGWQLGDRNLFPEDPDGKQHLFRAICNIPIRRLYFFRLRLPGLLHEIFSDQTDNVVTARQQHQLFLINACSCSKYRAVKDTLTLDEQQFISTGPQNITSDIQQLRTKEQELKSIIIRFWEEEKAEQCLTPAYLRKQLLLRDKLRRRRKTATRLLVTISLDDIPQEDWSCGICRQPYVGCESPEDLDTCRPGELPVQLPCGHKFGKSCVSSWLSEQKTCPLCRYDFKTTLGPNDGRDSDVDDDDDEYDDERDDVYDDESENENENEDEDEDEEGEEDDSDEDDSLSEAPSDRGGFPYWVVHGHDLDQDLDEPINLDFD